MITFHRLEYWPTSEGLDLVHIDADGVVRQVGVLWI